MSKCPLLHVFTYMPYSSDVPSFMYVPHSRCPSKMVDGDGIPLPGPKQGVAARLISNPGTA